MKVSGVLAVVLCVCAPMCAAEEGMACEKFVYEIIRTNPYYTWVGGEERVGFSEKVVVCREASNNTEPSCKTVLVVADTTKASEK